MTLDDSDVRRVLDATTMLVGDPPPEIPAVLTLLRELIPCASASFNDLALAAGDFRYVIDPADQRELAVRLKPAFDRHAAEHPLIVLSATVPYSGALRFCDVPDGDRLTETALYREFYEPFGIRHQLVIQLPSPPDVVVGFALNRSADQGEFSDRDVAVLNSLGAHLAMHHRRVIDAERAQVMDEGHGADAGWALLTVRADGVVEASSSSAVLAELAGAGPLPEAVVDLLPTFGDDETEPRRHDVMIDDRRWRCVVHPVPVGPTVLLVRCLGDESPVTASLVDLGLTARQIEVAVALARSGAGNAQLARQLDISEGTVKKHLEVVFRTLDVDTRAAAVALLAELAR
ncbi:MAG: helix-turn-helix transcriptional regulator [Ilumatobacteraceae bacterium]